MPAPRKADKAEVIRFSLAAHYLSLNQFALGSAAPLGLSLPGIARDKLGQVKN